MDCFDEVLILDTGSTDRTVEIAQRFDRVRLLHQEGIGNFGQTRNELTSRAKNDWVLHIDSDEFLSAEAVEEIASLSLNPKAAYQIRRRMVYRNKALSSFDEYKYRLYHRGTTSWSSRAVHENLILPSGHVGVRLNIPVEHHFCDSIADLMLKVAFYGKLNAEEFAGRKKTSPLSAVFRSSCMFLKFYVLKRGIWYGYEGFAISFYMALNTLIKHFMLYEVNHDKTAK